MKTRNPGQRLFAALALSLSLASTASAQWTITDLGLLGDTEGNDSQAWSINNLGHVVGYAYQGPYDAPALLWRDGTFVNLSELPEVLAAGWSSLSAQDVNDSDQVVGHGYHHGKLRAFLLSPSTVPVPFRITLTRDANGATLSFLSSAGTRYQVFTSAALQAADWEPVGDSISGSGGVVTTHVPLGQEPSRFFVIHTAP